MGNILLSYSWGLTQDQFEEYEAKNKAQGMTCIFRQAFTDSEGETRIQGIWAKLKR